MSKLKTLIAESKHPVQYVIGCVKYYAGKGMSWREVVEAEYAAMLECKNQQSV